MLFRRGVPGMAERARVNPGEIRIAMTQQDRQRSERLTWARVGFFRACGHNSASLPNMGWGLHCSGQIARLAIGSPSGRNYQQSSHPRDGKKRSVPGIKTQSGNSSASAKRSRNLFCCPRPEKWDQVVMDEQEAGLGMERCRRSKTFCLTSATPSGLSSIAIATVASMLRWSAAARSD